MRKILYLIVMILPFVAFSQQKVRFPIWTYHDKNTIVNGLSVGAFTTTKSEKDLITNGFRIEIPGFPFLKNTTPYSPISSSKEMYVTRKEEIFSEHVNGLSFSLIGCFLQGNVNGINVNGLLGSCYRINGISVGGIIVGAEISNGLQLAVIGTSAYIANGLQLSLYTNYTCHINGLQIAVLINESNGLLKGSQFGSYNKTVNLQGFQLGFVNLNKERVKGVQIGIFNKTQELKGIQIGLWNVNSKRKLPLINWGF